MKLYLNKSINFWSIIHSENIINKHLWICANPNKIVLDKIWLQNFVRNANSNKDYVKIKDHYTEPLFEIRVNDPYDFKCTFYKNRSNQHYLISIRGGSGYSEYFKLFAIINRTDNICMIVINQERVTKICVYTNEGVMCSNIDHKITTKNIISSTSGAIDKL